MTDPIPYHRPQGGVVSLFRKKPVVIEAVRWTGDNLDAVQAFDPRAYEGWFDSDVRWNAGSGAPMPPAYLIIPTLEGDHRAHVGDWIIRGVEGEFYPCKPDIFAQTYEPAERPPSGDDVEGRA